MMPMVKNEDQDDKDEEDNGRGEKDVRNKREPYTSRFCPCH